MNFIKHHRKAFMGIAVLLGLLVIIILLSFSPADRSILLGSAKTIEVDGINRTFRTYQTRQTDDPTTIIIALHHLGGDSRQMAYYSALQNDLQENTVLVYPDAIKPRTKNERPGWNADFCCGSGWKNNIDDKKFIETLINTLVTQYKPKNNKVFLVGFSNGAMFTHKLASELPDKIAGFAAIAGSIGVNDTQHNPTSPVPGLLIHGAVDQSVKIDGGISDGEPDFNWKPLSATQKSWEKANNCTSPQTKENHNTIETKYIKCDSPLIVKVNKHDKHQWPDWRLFNFWHKHPSGTKNILDFIYSL